MTLHIPIVQLTDPLATIYRVHHKDDVLQGMYQDKGPAFHTMLEIDGRHPLPRADPKLGWDDMGWDERDDHIFGFTNLEQLKFWIYKQEWIDDLSSKSFVISRLVAIGPAHVKHGRTQAIIDQHYIVYQSHIPWEVLNHD